MGVIFDINDNQIHSDIYPDGYTQCWNLFKLIKDDLIPNLDFAQFGVYVGCSTKVMLDDADSIFKPFRKAYLLDVFIGGFPKETEGVYINDTWYEGKLCLRQDRGLQTIDDVKNFLNNQLSHRSNLHYVVGYYKDSLTVELANQIGKEQLSFVDIDCDIHSSSLQALTFLFEYQLLCIGSIVRFDDFMGTPWTGGQKLALKQTIEKYKCVLSKISDTVYKLESY